MERSDHAYRTAPESRGRREQTVAKTAGLEIARAIEGFLLAKQAEGCSPNTIADYRNCLANHLCTWLAANGQARMAIDALTQSDLRAFMIFLRTKPNGRGSTLSPKTIRNVHVALQSLFSWAHEELGIPDIMPYVPAPKAPPVLVKPLSQEQVGALLRACERTSTAQTKRRATFSSKRGTALRDRAIVLLLVDSGMRCGELCRLAVEDVDQATGQISIRQAKGGSVRVVFIGKSARRALWSYAATRQHSSGGNPVFTTREGQPLTPDRVTKLIANLGRRAGFHVHPHQLRHTFATMFLRNGGNLLSLQRLLGHSSLEMVRRYAAIADADLATAHRDASPADRWRL